MRQLSFVVAVAAVGGWVLTDREVAAGARCSYVATYPSAVGQQTYLLATATPTAVLATPDSAAIRGIRTVRAQVMRIGNVAGYRADAIRAGLRANGDSAVFIRYRISMSCAPFPAADGAFDSADVGGLYVGRPRDPARWIEGKPTFDVIQAEHFPLPQRISGPSGHLVITRVDSTPTMTADELLVMYRELWAESASVNDRSPELRLRRWRERHPRSALKQPAEQVAIDMLSASTRATVAAGAIPFGGTFAISVVVPRVDSFVTYGRTSSRARPWIVEVARDSLTGVPVAYHAKSFAIDITTAAAPSALVPPGGPVNPCSPIVVVVAELPIRVGADSSWSGEMSTSGFLNCAPSGSALLALARPGANAVVASEPAPVQFRRHPDGRITFAGRTREEGKAQIHVRGEQISPAADR